MCETNPKQDQSSVTMLGNIDFVAVVVTSDENAGIDNAYWNIGSWWWHLRLVNS